MPLFKTPFSRSYWKEALKSFRSIRGMVFAALMIAACIVLSHFSIKVTDVLTVSFSFLARALCALVYGPVGALVFGAAEDTLSFLLNSKGYPYFPGYMLTTMLGCFTYALFFYRTKVTVAKIFLAKLITNVQNVFLGASWSAILYSKGYLYYMTTSAVKNLISLPIYTLMLVVVFQALLPVMHKIGIIPNQLGEKGRMKLF
ncbi:MAG: folate family ECF transporter S component [Oscillospiraceae bacterium]